MSETTERKPKREMAVENRAGTPRKPRKTGRRRGAKSELEKGPLNRALNDVLSERGRVWVSTRGLDMNECLEYGQVFVGLLRNLPPETAYVVVKALQVFFECKVGYGLKGEADVEDVLRLAKGVYPGKRIVRFALNRVDLDEPDQNKMYG